jgi:hypothetical protein
MGGLAPKDAAKILQRQASFRFAHKNLFFLEISSGLDKSMSSRTFNMLATDVEYAPITIAGEKNKIGGTSADSVRSSEPIELRITTFDNRSGVIREWFDEHAAAAASSNGTVGVPADFAINIKITLAYTESNEYAYMDNNLYRAANLEMSLSRREDALQELQLSFVQLDLFMPVSGKS